MAIFHPNTIAAVQRRINAGLSEFDIGDHHYWVGIPVTLLHNVECRHIHQSTRRGIYYQRELLLYNGVVYTDHADVYAAAERESAK